MRDEEVLWLLKLMLKASGKQGVPQGGVISPLLSNVYLNGKCCNFKNGDGERLGSEVSCSHLEQPVDELNLSPNIRAAHPPHLPLPNHVHGLVSLDCSPRRVKLAKPLLGLHPSFDRSMVLLQDIVQVTTVRLTTRGRAATDCSSMA